MKEKDTIKKRLQALWADSRTYKKRLLFAAFPMLALCYTLIFFGPLELVAFSGESLLFSYRDIWWLLALFALGIFAAGTLLVSLLRGKIYNYAVSSLFAIGVGAYLQAAFLNGGLGTLTGDAIRWTNHAWAMAGGLLVWLLVFLAVFFIMYLSRDLWRKTVKAVCLLLVIMQLVPTMMILLGAYEQTKESTLSNHALTDTGMYEFSKEDNVFVFVLDRLDYTYLQAALEADPDFLEGLDGFTWYTNAISAYARTRPALASLLTGYTDGAYLTPTEDYYKDAWTASGTNILESITSQGYTIEAYTKTNYLFSDPDMIDRYITNHASNTETAINAPVLLGKLMQLSAYRYVPTVAKPFCWADTNYYNTDTVVSTQETVYQFNDGYYGQGFTESTADRKTGSFKFYHFFGPHAPYTLNADGTDTGEETTVVDQTLGSFANLQRAFDRMKELGIYEDATIIITGDHGRAISDCKPIQCATLIGLFYKPSGSAGTPLTVSTAQVSTQNIPATLLKAVGADYSAFDRPLDEIGETEELVRYTFKSVADTQTYKEKELYVYQVTGNAADFANWQIVEVVPVKYPFY